MPIQIFTEAERAKLDTFPEEITHNDLITFFTLSESDREQLPFFSAPHNRLGFALQLCTLRFMGFVPEALTVITFQSDPALGLPGDFSQATIEARIEAGFQDAIAQRIWEPIPVPQGLDRLGARSIL